MENKEVITKIKDLAEPFLRSNGCDLVDITCGWYKDRMLLRLLIDKPDGITMGECAQINTRLGFLLDESGIIHGPYVLEVSSPGLDRPLVNKRDFERVMGKYIEVHCIDSVDGKRFYAGKLLNADDIKITVQTKEGLRIDIPLNNINKASQQINF